MHGYYRSPDRLERLLVPHFIDRGQFQMEINHGEVLRGEVESVMISKKPGEKVLKVTLKWLCRKGSAFDRFETLRTKWFELPPALTGSTFIDLSFTSYYFQPDEERVKMWTSFGEVCHFFKKDDYQNLLKNDEGEFIPLYVLKARELKLALLKSCLSEK